MCRGMRRVGKGGVVRNIRKRIGQRVIFGVSDIRRGVDWRDG